MKNRKHVLKDKNKTLEVVTLLIAILCISIGFLAYSNQLKIQSELTAHPDQLTFRVVFSTSHKGEETKPVEAKIEPRDSGATAENAIIYNKNGPAITNLNVKFTESGQKARYAFYVYNAGEYMAYLNDIVYSNVPYTNLKKACIAKDGITDDSIKKACDNIKISIKIADITTSKSLYYIKNRHLRPRTAQPVEVTIEYLKGDSFPNKEFEVIFGNIYLNYAMFPNNGYDI